MLRQVRAPRSLGKRAALCCTVMALIPSLKNVSLP
jgi:hypothetical protein